MIKYDKLLNVLDESKEENHLLLANGFNYSLCVNTGYKNIFSKMKEKYKGYEELNIVDNFDIEYIIGELKKQVSNDGPYKVFLDNYINNKVKSDFMKSAYEIAKDGIKNIYQEKNEGIGILFKNFNNFFTLNYDPFLYLLLMKYKNGNTSNVLSFQNTLEFKISDLNIKNTDLYKDIKNIYLTHSKELINENGEKIIGKPLSQLSKTDFEKQLNEILKSKNKKFKKEYVTVLYEELKEAEISLDINDGFIGELFNVKPVIDSYVQNVFFLHGSFHIYKDKQSIYKITKTQDKALYERLDEIIGEEDKEIVSVFTNDSKILEIEENEYLVKGIEKLKNIKGSLVIIGSSLDKNDEHIFNALNESSVDVIFHASNVENETSDKNRLTELFPNKEIILFDRDSITYEKRKIE